MKALLLPLIILLSSTLLTAQQTPEWERVYTFDESIIEMNTVQVTFDGKSTGRVRFRWSFEQPQTFNRESKAKYNSQLEVIEFDCSNKLYRPYETTWFDAAGQKILFTEANPPGEWRPFGRGDVLGRSDVMETPARPVLSRPMQSKASRETFSHSEMMEKLAIPACRLIEEKRKPLASVVPNVSPDLERAEKFAVTFFQRLERTKDFAPLVKEFFRPDYLNGYLQDKETNWFYNLSRETAAAASQAELQRYYIALQNSAYLGSQYFVSRNTSEAEENLSEEKLISPEVVRLIEHHPYTARYRGAKNDYAYLAEKIESLDQLRLYTDLLEKINAAFRSQLISLRAKQPERYLSVVKRLDDEFGLSRPLVRVCVSGCLGLPAGTRLFVVDVSVFRVQLAEINGALRVVSAQPNF